MTPEEWDESSDLARMLEWVTQSDPNGYCKEPKYRVSDRKLRLFAAACYRDVIAAARGIANAEEAANEAEWWAERGEAMPGVRERSNPININDRAIDHATGAASWSHYHRGKRTRDELNAMQANLLREIIGNPWKPVALPTSRVRCDWCNATGEIAFGGDSYGYGRTYEKCRSCDGEGWREGPCPWLTPTVVSLATAAYQERGQECGRCSGRGEFYIVKIEPVSKTKPSDEWVYPMMRKDFEVKKCHDCHGTGLVEGGRLDNARLQVLADALEDAGCPETVECEQCNGQGGWELRGWTHDSWDQCGICLGKGIVPNPILSHLRSDGVHVRGMWSLDLLLGKA